MGEHVNEFVVGVIDRNPVSDVGHAVLFEKLARVIAEPRQQIVEVPRRSVIRSQFEQPLLMIGGASRLN